MKQHINQSRKWLEWKYICAEVNKSKDMIMMV